MKIPLDDPEYMRMPINLIPPEFVAMYGLLQQAINKYRLEDVKGHHDRKK